MTESIIAGLSMNFAIRIVKFYKYLAEEKKIFVISKQLLRAGTSIGANISEAFYAQSRADFINKMNIALKEAGESEFWITLLYKSELIDQKSYDSLISDVKQIIGTLVKIINSSKKGKSVPLTF
ncbi:MAG: four helix bundle protein [Bacteroidaceae bacterium]|jgi:four helix bundle protein|nr:four helix bundle protein [Bacteroidaceae bacterium]